MLTKRQVILMKVETSYKADPTPLPADDAILVENVSWGFANQRMTPQGGVRPQIGMLKQIYGGSLFSLSFDMQMKGSGAAGTPPECGVPLRACGFGEDIDAGVSVTYEPVSTGIESAHIYFYEDGKLYIIGGCRGNVSCTMASGEPGKLSFAFTGHLLQESDTALVDPTLDTTVPPAILLGGMSIGSYSAILSQVTWDMGNSIATPPSVNAANGYGEITITGRDVNGTLDPEATLVATNDFIGDWTAGTQLALDAGQIGSVAGQIHSTDMPQVSYRDVAPGDRDGIRTLELPFGAEDNAGDDEISVVFT